MSNGKNKVERYIERYCSKLITKKIYSVRSTYYHFGHRIIRVSDHVAFNSDGDLSIILDSHDDEHFIVHAVTSGEISVVTYPQLKEIIKVFRLLPAVVYIANKPEKVKQPNPVRTDVLVCKPKPGEKIITIPTSSECKIKELRVAEKDCYILGVHINNLKKGFVSHVATQIAATLK